MSEFAVEVLIGDTFSVVSGSKGREVIEIWQDLGGAGGGGAVSSVNGEVGAVVLSAADVGAAPAAHTHSSTQINDFIEAVQDAVGAFLSGASGVSVTYDDSANTITVSGLGGGGGLDAEAVRDAIGVAMVGLGNIAVTVNDTADTITITTIATVNDTDANLRNRATHTGQQPISSVTNLQETLDAMDDVTAGNLNSVTESLSNKADLEDGVVPASQLPSFVDDIEEFANLAAFPAVGETGKIYVALDTNFTYRWGGSTYTQTNTSLALGETSGTAYRGDRGKTAYDHSQLTNSNPHGVTKAHVGLGNVDNTSDLEKPISTATQGALDAKADDASLGTAAYLPATDFATAAQGARADAAQPAASLDSDAASLINGGGDLRDAVDSRVALGGGGGGGTDVSPIIANRYAVGRTDANDKARIASERVIQINNYLNATELLEPWASLSGWQTLGAASVSGGRLVGGLNAKVLKSFAFDWADTSQVARIVVTGTRPSGISGSSMFLALDLGAANHVPGTGDKYIGIGLNTGGNRDSFYSNMGGITFEYEVNEAVATPGTYGNAPGGTADYTFSIDIGPENVSFCVVDTGALESGMVVLTVKRSVLAAAAASSTNLNIMLAGIQSSGTAISFGPLAAYRTLEKSRDSSYASLDTTSRWVVPKYNPAGEIWAYQLPPNYDPMLGAPLALFFHQSATGDWNELWDEGQPNQVPKVAEALRAAGYIIACCSDTGDRWGNAASLANYLGLYQYITKYHNVTEVFYWGSSMGGGAILNALMHTTLPTPRAVALVAGLVNYRDIWTRHLKSDGSYAALKTSFKAAFGITSDTDSDPNGFNAKTAGYRPEDEDGYKFRGVPLKYWYGATGLNKDDVVEIGDGTHANIDALINKIDDFVPEASVVETAGPHGSTDSYRDAEIVAFFQTYRHSFTDESELGLVIKTLKQSIDLNTAALVTANNNISVNAASLARRNNYVIKNAANTLLVTDPVNVFCDPGGADWTQGLPATTTPGIEFFLRFAPNVDDTTHVITISGLFVVRGGATTQSGLRLFAYNQWYKVISTSVSGSWRLLEASDVSVPTGTHATDVATLPYGVRVSYY